MSSTIRRRNFTGTTDPAPQAYEQSHRELARKAAQEGIVLKKMKIRFFL